MAATKKTPEQEIARLKDANKKLRKEKEALRLLFQNEISRLEQEKAAWEKSAKKHEALYIQVSDSRDRWLVLYDNMEEKVKKLQKLWTPPEFTVLEFSRSITAADQKQEG